MILEGDDRRFMAKNRHAQEPPPGSTALFPTFSFFFAQNSAKNCTGCWADVCCMTIHACERKLRHMGQNLTHLQGQIYLSTTTHGNFVFCGMGLLMAVRKNQSPDARHLA